MKWKTLEEWYYRYQKEGLDGLFPRQRSDKGRTKAISAELCQLIVELKREDPGRSVPLIIMDLEQAAVVERRSLKPSPVRRLLQREGLSGPQLELARPSRHRWQVSSCGELWQCDACHGPKLFDPASGRELRVKIFGLIDDCSRLVPYVRAGFRETQAAFLEVLCWGRSAAVARHAGCWPTTMAASSASTPARCAHA